MTRRKRNILKSLVVGVAVAAVAAPTALGEPRGPGNPMISPASSSSVSPDDRSLNRATLSVEQQIGSDDRPLYRGTEPRPVTVSYSPDDRSLYRGAEPRPVTVSFDPSLPRGGPVDFTSPANVTPFIASPGDRPAVSAASDDFQWGDAGLGAGLALALIMLLGGSALVIRHQRQRIAAY